MSDDVSKEKGAPGEPRHLVPIRIEQALAAAAMALICLISMGNVVARYFTNVSFAFTEEFSVFLLVFMTFVGASAVFAKDQHIRIVALIERLPRPLWWASEMLALAVTILVFAMVAYYAALFTLDQYRYNETSPGLGYPQWIYSIWLPILSIAIILRVLGRVAVLIRQRP